MILRALSKSPNDRYPSVAIFRQKLIQSLLSYLSPEKGLYLMASPRSTEESLSARPDAADWPGWLWGGLLAANVAAMLALAVLLFSPCQ